jgi:hypothetical protein
MLCLNLPGQNAYMAQAVYEWSIGRGHGSKTGQSVILESKQNLPYIKIAPKTNLFTGLKFFYKPADADLRAMEIDKNYNLFCLSENTQLALDILQGVFNQIKKDKFIVEVSGNWIVVIKWGYTTNFDKFVSKALPIAKAFCENSLVG